MSNQTTAPLFVTEAAAALIHKDVLSFKADRKRYAEYVAEMNVTTETVAAHVALFRDAYRTAMPKASGDEVKAYSTKVRNGLNYQVGKGQTNDETPKWLLTTDGLAAIGARLDALDDADLTTLNPVNDLIRDLMAEVEKRAK